MWTSSHHESYGRKLEYCDACWSDLGGAPLLAPWLVPGCAGHEGLALVGEGEHAGHSLLHPRVTLPGHGALLGWSDQGQTQEAGHWSDHHYVKLSPSWSRLHCLSLTGLIMMGLAMPQWISGNSLGGPVWKLWRSFVDSFIRCVLHVQCSLEIKSCSWRDFVRYCIDNDLPSVCAFYNESQQKEVLFWQGLNVPSSQP